jgi:protein-tyrosine kinase
MDRILRALDIARRGPGADAEAALAEDASARSAGDSAPATATSPWMAAVPSSAVGATPASQAPAARPLPAVQTRARYALAEAAGLRERRILLANDAAGAARAYRMLRAQLLQRARATRRRVFGVISAVSGEGKTVTAINLALTLAAEPNQSVGLIDFDLRHPSIAQTLGIAPSCGLETWLTSDLPSSELACELDGMARLLIVPTLEPLAASSETLAGGRARGLLEELKAEDPGRLLILDLPPALLSDDVLTISPLVDGFIFVVTEAKTRREDVERVIELVGRERIVGTVLNRSVDSEQRAY